MKVALTKNLDNLAHLVLLLGFLTGAFALFQLRYDSAQQFLIVLLMSVFYLIWGLVYHHAKSDFTLRLFLEYMVICALTIASAVLVYLK